MNEVLAVECVPWAPDTQITLGCDPEFELVTSEGVVAHAHNYSFFSHDPNGPIGIDGGQVQVELRPDPSSVPETVVNRLYGLVDAVKSEGFDLSVSGHRYPLGGHIHFGIKDFVDLPSQAIARFVRVLDSFLGSKVLSLSGRARRRQGYRALTLYRPNGHGFEYRTPPSAIFATKKFSRLCLQIAKGLADCFFGTGTMTFHRRPLIGEYKRYTGLNGPEITEFKKTIRELKRAIKQTEAYLVEGVRSTILNVVFSSNDVWSLDVQEELTRQLRAAIPTVTSIYLYGLNESRGMCCTVPVAGMELVTGVSGRGIGLPYAVRTNIETFTSFMPALVEGIKNYVLASNHQQ